MISCTTRAETFQTVPRRDWKLAWRLLLSDRHHFPQTHISCSALLVVSETRTRKCNTENHLTQYNAFTVGTDQKRATCIATASRTAWFLSCPLDKLYYCCKALRQKYITYSFRQYKNKLSYDRVDSAVPAGCGQAIQLYPVQKKKAHEWRIIMNKLLITT